VKISQRLAVFFSGGTAEEQQILEDVRQLEKDKEVLSNALETNRQWLARAEATNDTVQELQAIIKDLSRENRMLRVSERSLVKECNERMELANDGLKYREMKERTLFKGRK
jgi:hypothetical protein